MNPEFVIQTRQKDDQLFRLERTTITPATAVPLPAREIVGYGEIRFLVFSEEPMTLRIEQSPTGTGPWVETERLTSIASPSDLGQNMICAGVAP